ncbi:MAG: hypothetical protein IJ189_13265 [Clostridia bacterium]|nr:hypothetical protein [Clostridia bacterium]
MKKSHQFYCVLLLSFLLASQHLSACGEEILFRGIPWLSSLTEVQASFGEEVPIDAVDEMQMLFYSKINGDFSNASDGFAPYPSGWVAFAPLSWYDVKVAGLEVKDMYIYCCYGIEDDHLLKDADSSQFYLASYSFGTNNKAEAYLELISKLSSLYGEGNEQTDDQSYLPGETFMDHSVKWEGDNHTAAVLSYRGLQSDDGEMIYDILQLTYGKTDSDTLIQAICDLSESAAVNAKAQHTDDVNGL